MSRAEFSYPLRTLALDALRAGAGALVCGGLAASLPWSWFPAGLLALLCVVLLGYMALTVAKSMMRIELTVDGIRRMPGARMVPWGAIVSMRLVYYSTRRDREDGWMELTLRADGERLRLDSRLDRFQDLLALVLRHTAAHGISLDADTLYNLNMLGLRPTT